jgi:hypothetical protein
MSKKLTEIKEMIESAEAALKSAKRLLLEIGDVPSSGASHSFSEPASSEEGKVIEGVFNGERMIATDGENYPVPANYASKSKLVAGDHLKLSIMKDGRFVYKQIGPVPRKTIIGTLVHEEGQYKVIANTKVYKVLLASVTYYKAHVGDKVTVIIPDADDTEWCTIEAVLPKNMSELNVNDDEPGEEESVDF